MSEPLRISYALVGTGWSTCVVEAGSQRAEVTASYLSNALSNLVLSALSMASGFRTVVFGFDEEPGEYRWVLEVTDNNTVRLRLLEFPELWGHEPNEAGRLLLEVSTTPVAYAKAVQTCASAVLEQYGAAGYAEKWAEGSFPERELALLGAAIAGWEK